MVPHHARRLINQRFTDRLRGGLIDEVIARIGLSVRIPGDDFNSMRPRFTQNTRNAGPVFNAYGNGVDVASDPALDHFVLFGSIQTGGAVPDHVDMEIFCGLLSADAATDEIGIAFRLRHNADSHHSASTAGPNTRDAAATEEHHQRKYSDRRGNEERTPAPGKLNGFRSG